LDDQQVLVRTPAVQDLETQVFPTSIPEGIGMQRPRLVSPDLVISVGVAKTFSYASSELRRAKYFSSSQLPFALIFQHWGEDVSLRLRLYQFAVQIRPIPQGGTGSTCSFSALLLRGGRPVATATQRLPRPDMYRDVLRIFHPADGENRGASLGKSVMRNGVSGYSSAANTGITLRDLQ